MMILIMPFSSSGTILHGTVKTSNDRTNSSRLLCSSCLGWNSREEHAGGDGRVLGGKGAARGGAT